MIGGEGVVEGRVSGGEGIGGEGVVEGRGSGGGRGVALSLRCCSHVVVLGPRCRSRVVVLDPCRHSHVLALGARRRSHAVVLGPRQLVSLAPCCRPRVAISCLSFIGERGVGGKRGGGSKSREGVEEGARFSSPFTRAGPLSPFARAGPLSPFAHAGVGPSSVVMGGVLMGHCGRLWVLVGVVGRRRP